MIEGQHYQLAYVTPDIRSAVADLKKRAYVRHESYWDGDIEVSTPQGLRVMRQKLALLWVENVQYEFIQVIEGMEHVYGAAIKTDGSLGFHHLCSRVSDWADFRKRVDQQDLPIALWGEAGPLKFLYLDARKTCGHYLEYCSMPDEMWLNMGGC